MKYDAFISYRHAPADIEVSEQIHKRLERLRVPGSIRKTTGKKRIQRVFRDQEELTVSSSLSDEILSALDESEFLIVICSPRTPESEWVENEVSYFIKVHGREKVLPVLIEGEPKDSFPKPLLYEEKREIDVRGEAYVYQTIAEPFAADYRAPDSQTRSKIIKKEIFRLAAPILGCRYDDLKQRHREQRNRRIIAAVTAVALLGVAFGVYNYVQNQKILENFRKQQITQSRYLADTSLRLLDQGDRTKAIQIALEALPKDLGNPERPIVPSAEYALSKALHAYSIGSDLVPDYTVELDAVAQSNMEISPSGLFFAVLDQRGAVNIFELKTGKTIAKLSSSGSDGTVERFYDFRVLPDDRLIAFGNTKVMCADGSTGAVLWSLSYEDINGKPPSGFHGAPFFSVSGDGRFVGIRLDADDSCYVLSSADGSIVSNVTWDPGELYMSGMALSEDGSRLAILLCDIFKVNATTVQTFDVPSGAMLAQFEQTYFGGFYLSFTADGRLICGTFDFENIYAVSGDVGVRFTCHSPEDGAVLWNSDYLIQKSTGDLMINQTTIIRSEEYGDSVLLVAANKILAFDLETGILKAEVIAPSRVTGTMLNQESGYMVYVTDIGQVKWLSLYLGLELSDYDFVIQTEIMAMKGKSGYMISVPYNSKIVLVYSFVEAPDRETVYEFADEYSLEKSVVSPDNKDILHCFLSGDLNNGRACLFDAKTGALKSEFDFESSVKDAAIQGDRILFALRDGTILTYDTGEEEPERISAGIDLVLQSDVCQDQSHIVLADALDLVMLEVSTGEVVFECELDADENNKASYVAVSDDAKFIILRDNTGLYAVRTKDGKTVPFESRVDLSEGYHCTVVFDETSDRAAIPCADQCVRIVDLKSGKIISTIETAIEDIFSGCFIEKGSVLIFQNDDHRVRAANVDTGRLIYTGEDEICEVEKWALCPKREVLAAVSVDKALLFGIRDGIHPLAEVPGFTSFSSDGSSVYVIDYEMLYRFPYRELGDLVRIAKEELGGRELSEESRIKYYLDE